MYIYIISNFKTKTGKLDYKNLDLSGNYGQLYPENLEYAVVCNDELFEHEDLEIITEEQYEKIKLEIEKKQNQDVQSQEQDQIYKIQKVASELDNSVKSELGLNSAMTSMEIMSSIFELEAKVETLEKELGGK